MSPEMQISQQPKAKLNETPNFIHPGENSSNKRQQYNTVQTVQSDNDIRMFEEEKQPL